MKKNNYIYLSIFFVVILGGIFLMKSIGKTDTNTTLPNQMEAMVLSVSSTDFTVQDQDNIIYTFPISSSDIQVGDKIVIEYTGLLDKNSQIQDVSILNYDILSVAQDVEDHSIPDNWIDGGIFKDYYTLAKNKLDSLTLDEKIGQIFLVRYPDTDTEAINALKKYNFAGYTFYGKDFNGKTKTQVIKMINNLQDVAKIPILTAVDEEGGSVVRVSSNPNLASSKFKSPSELYKSGGFDLIRQDTIEKSNLLSSLGLNLNLAPVVDVSTSDSDYMYNRSLQENTALTSTFAETVIKASKLGKVSYTLKHFPGYGNNSDTHTGSSIDTRSYNEIRKNDLPPFQAGIDAGAEAVLVSHNVVNEIDPNNPASLSTSIHNLLRNDLGFTGVIMTDDLDMGATSQIEDRVVKAILAGNDLLLVTNYEDSIAQVKEALEDGTLSENTINRIAFRILAWKYYKGLMIENQK